MAKVSEKIQKRLRRKVAIRKQVMGTSARPRLSVFRSARHIYAQVIDDLAGHTLAAASTMDKELREQVKGLKKAAAAAKVGEKVAERCLARQIEKVVFDRSGFKYHGRVKSLAEAARGKGLKF